MYHDHGSYGFVISFHYCRMWDQKLCTIFVRQENRELCALRAKAFHVFGKDPFLAPKMNESISTMQTREPTTFIFRGYKPHVSWFLGSKGRVLRDFLPIPAHSLVRLNFTYMIFNSVGSSTTLDEHVVCWSDWEQLQLNGWYVDVNRYLRFMVEVTTLTFLGIWISTKYEQACSNKKVQSFCCFHGFHSSRWIVGMFYFQY